jgi:hypothetical protein
VEHVRVGEDQVRPLADLPAALLLRVAVVDRGADARHLELRERAELVLRERLRRIEVERPLLRVGRESVEHGQVERERLAGCGPRRDDHVVAVARRSPRLGLVAIERLDPARGERLAHARVQVIGNRLDASLPRGVVAEMGELVSLQQVGPRARFDGHRAIVTTPREQQGSGTGRASSRLGKCGHGRCLTLDADLLACPHRGALRG